MIVATLNETIFVLLSHHHSDSSAGLLTIPNKNLELLFTVFPALYASIIVFLSFRVQALSRHLGMQRADLQAPSRMPDQSSHAAFWKRHFIDIGEMCLLFQLH